jgi:hypothetical protein
MRVLIIGLAGALAAFGAGANGKCTLVALQWVIDSGGGANAIQPDPSGAPYVNGVNGVKATLDTCAGTGDATLYLDPALPLKRDLKINLTNSLQITSLTPQELPSVVGCRNICWLLVIRNLNFASPTKPKSAEYDFTTHLAGGGPLNSHVWMMPDGAEAAANVSNSTAINFPNPNSLVNVHHCPAGIVSVPAGSVCTPGIGEQWIVTPIPTGLGPVATLWRDAIRPNKAGNGGQFLVPFRFVITGPTPLP